MNKNIRLEYFCPQFSGGIKEYCNQLIKFLIPPYLLGPCFKLFDKKIIESIRKIFFLQHKYNIDRCNMLVYRRLDQGCTVWTGPGEPIMH